MAKIKVIQQGVSLPFCFDLDGESITDWICTIIVKQYPTETALIERVVEPDSASNTWPGFLTAAETETLGESSTSPFTLAGILTNSTTGEAEQVPIRFNVAPSWA